MKYNLAQDTIPKKHLDKAARWLRTYPHLTQGKKVKEFETKWSDHLGVDYSTFVNSGSSANLLAYAVIKEYLLQRGDPLTVAICGAGWSTTISPAYQLGFDVTFIDVDLKTLSMSAASLEEVLRTKQISLVVFVPTLGFPGDITKVVVLKSKYNFILMEDACPAVGTKTHRKYVGTLGDIGTFSFYYGHQISTIEGGMVSTSRADLNELLKMIRNHGWSADLEEHERTYLEKEHNIDAFHSRFTFYVPGLNVRSTEFNAVLGLEQLKILDRVALARDRNVRLYQKLLYPYFIVPTPSEFPDDGDRISCITYPLICESPEQREIVAAALAKASIETRPISGGNLGVQPFTKHKDRFATENLFQLHYNGLVLPCHPGLFVKDVKFIADTVIQALLRSREQI